MNVILSFFCFFINYKNDSILATRPSNWAIASDWSIQTTLAAVFTEKDPWNKEITTAGTFKLSVGSVSNVSLATDTWPMSIPSSSKSNGFSEACSSTLDFFGVRASLAMSSSTDFRPCRKIGSSYSRKKGDPVVVLTNLAIWWGWTSFIPLGKRIFSQKWRNITSLVTRSSSSPTLAIFEPIWLGFFG